jgi:Yeast mitochondrial distribution and morphology (MDM) proteins
MEVLVVVLAALATLLLPLALLLASGAVLGASGLTELVVAGRRQATTEPAATASTVARWAWRLLAASGVVVVALLIVVVALNTFAFDWFVRRALAAAQTQNGIAAEFDQADGNLFVGKLHLRDARFVRQGHAVSDFDLVVDDLRLNADAWKMLFGQIEFEDVAVDGVRGTFTRNGRRDPNMPRRQFTIDRLTVDNVSLEVADKSRPPHGVSVPLEIESMKIADFRSTWAAFDMLFRSTCQGLVDSQPFTIVNRATDDGEAQETQWVARDVPVHLLSGYFAGPLSWLVDGQLDVDVTTSWRSDESDPELQMHCYVVAHGFAANIPDQLPVLQKIAEPALAVLGQSTARLPMEFVLTMPKDAFRGQLSPLAAGLAEALAQGSGTAFTKLLPNAGEKIGETVDRIRERIQERRRARERRRGAKNVEDGETAEE